MTDTGYSVDVALRWGDMDAYGHVNNVQYLRLLEDARVAAFADWMAGPEAMIDSGVVVSRHEIEYVAPLTYRRAPVRIHLWPTHIAGATFDLGYEVRDPVDLGGALYARAASTLVPYHLDTGRPRRLSDQERARLQERLGEPVAFRWRR